MYGNFEIHMKEKQKKSINIVHMGDSITFGQHVETHLRWTDIVKDFLEQKYLCEDFRRNYFNCGISGETTLMGLARYARDVQELKPDVMTLQFGLNDCNCWETDMGLPRVSPMCFKANLIEMIVRARHFGCQAIILATNHVTLNYKTMISGELYEDANARYNEIICEIAKEINVQLCDIRRVFESFSNAELSELLLPSSDLLHLSVKGNKVYAEAILPFVEKAINKVLN